MITSYFQVCKNTKNPYSAKVYPYLLFPDIINATVSTCELLSKLPHININIKYIYEDYFPILLQTIFYHVLFRFGLRTIWWTLKLRLLCHTPRMHFIRGLIAKATMLSPVIVPWLDIFEDTLIGIFWILIRFTIHFFLF